MVPVVDVVKGHRGNSEDIEVFWVGLAKLLGNGDRVDEDRCSSSYAVPQTMKDLVSGRMLEVPSCVYP